MLLAPAPQHSSRRRLSSPRFFATQREDDPESQTKYYRARSMDPRTGRFLEKDSEIQERIEAPYSYVHDSPVSHRDPTGRLTILIHGGGGKLMPPDTFYKKGSPSAKALGDELSKAGDVDDVWKIVSDPAGPKDVDKVFTWSHGDTTSARVEAGAELFKYVNDIKGG